MRSPECSETHDRPGTPIPTRQRNKTGVHKTPKWKSQPPACHREPGDLAFLILFLCPPYCSAAFSLLGRTHSLLGSFQLRPPLSTITLFRKKITVNRKKRHLWSRGTALHPTVCVCYGLHQNFVLISAPAMDSPLITAFTNTHQHPTSSRSVLCTRDVLTASLANSISWAFPTHM